MYYIDFSYWFSFKLDLYYIEVETPYSLVYYAIELINENYNQFLNYFNYVKN